MSRARVLLLLIPQLVAAACMLAGSPASAAPTSAGSPTLAFAVRQGRLFNYFLRRGPVAANLVLRSGAHPRIVIAFPAGDSGVGLWFEPGSARASWSLLGRPRAARARDARGRPLYGISAEVALAGDPALEIRQAALSSVRVLRDYRTAGRLPPGIATAAISRGHTLTWSRNRLDGAAGYRLRVEVLDGRLSGRRILAGPDHRIALRVTGLTGEKPLVPLGGRALLLDPAGSNTAARDTLTFLAYREKLLAGSWRFDTYFGRDTLVSLRLLLPALTATAVDDALESVLARLSPQGEVAHEEDIGEQAILDHRQADGSLSAAPVYHYQMIDEDYLLAPVAAAWLLDPRERPYSAVFLAGTVAGPRDRRETRGAALVRNLAYVLHSAAGFAREARVAHLIGLKPGQSVGDWRDGENGLGSGRYPYDVNAVLVPAALDAAARLDASGLLSPYLTASERALFHDAAQMAKVWRAEAPPLFVVTVPRSRAARDIETFAASQGIPAQPALAALGTRDVRFPALALSASGRPVPVMQSDEGYWLLFADPDPQVLGRTVATLMRPFPAGLMTGAGMLVSNPAYAGPALRAEFSRNAYQGTVIWSWQQALFAAGLARQLRRRDLPASVRARLRQAQRLLWSAIEATRSMANSELWSWSYVSGRYEPRPFGSSAADVTESDAAQLWSTAFLAVRPP